MKTTKKLLAVILACLLVVPAMYIQVAAVGEAVWDGTTDTTWYNDTATEFTLTTAKQLAGLAELVDGGNTFADKTIKLGADIYLNDVSNFATWGETAPANNWNPIGKYDSTWFPFEGNFFGQGHTIYGLYIADQDRSGFFTDPASSTIKDLNFENAYVKCGTNGAAILCAQPKGGTALTITNVRINNFVVVGGSSDGAAAVVANLSSYSEGATFEKVTVTNGTISNIKARTGGILGQCAGSGTTAINFTDAIVENVTITGTEAIGGVAGQLKGAADATVNFKNVMCKADIEGSGAAIGGIMGNTNGTAMAITFDNCAFAGSVKSTENARVGGILGCYNNGDEQTTTFSNCSVEAMLEGTDCVGGLVGYGIHNNHSFSFSNCSVNATITCAGSYGALIGKYGNTKANTKTVTINNFYYSLSGVATSTLGVFGGTSESADAANIASALFYTPDANTETAKADSGIVAKANATADCSAFYAALDKTLWTSTGILLQSRSDTFISVGASIRYEAPTGIRFAFNAYDHANKEVKSRGVLVIPKDVLGEGTFDINTAKVRNIPAYLYYTEANAGYVEGYKTFSGVLIDIPAESFEREICACGYTEYTDGTIVYTDVMTKTYKGVAQACYADQTPEVKAALDGIFGAGFAN